MLWSLHHGYADILEEVQPIYGLTYCQDSDMASEIVDSVPKLFDEVMLMISSRCTNTSKNN